MSRRFYVAPLSAGLQDVGGEDGQELPRWYRYQNWRAGPGGSIVRRKGCQRFARMESNNAAYSLNGSTQFVTVNKDVRAHTLKKYWTIEVLAKPTNFTAVGLVLDTDHASNYSIRGPYFTTGGKVEVKVQDSAAAVTTLTSATTYSTGTTCAIQVVRDGTSLYLRVNGALEASGSIADLNGMAPGGNMLIGKSQAAAYFLGPIDFVRGLSTVLPDQRYGMIRWPYPYEEVVLFSYEMEEEITARVNDRSRFENHGVVSGSPTASTSNALCVSTMPVFGIAEWEDRDARSRVFAPVGNGFILETLNK